MEPLGELVDEAFHFHLCSVWYPRIIMNSVRCLLNNCFISNTDFLSPVSGAAIAGSLGTIRRSVMPERQYNSPAMILCFSFIGVLFLIGVVFTFIFCILPHNDYAILQSLRY